jgi:hypothetical protein
MMAVKRILAAVLLVGSFATTAFAVEPEPVARLADAAKQLDATTTSGGPTAAQNQKIQELTFNLQQIQQTLN